MTNESRGSFGSRLGVVLASAGSAVGLGNVWRFPTEAHENGGAAFMLVYLAMVLLLAMPVMVGEFLIGRASGANAVHSYRALGAKGAWRMTGFVGVIGGFMVLSFYCVVAGWTLASAISSLAGTFHSADYAESFHAFTSNPWQPIVCLAVFMLLTHFVVSRGVQRGIERFSKWMMPVLLIILVVLMILSLMMPGASEGVEFLFKPDFSKLSAEVVLSAMGQAFFTLSVGISCLATYASYFKRDTPLVKSALNVCVIDTMVAVMSGLIIFPALCSMTGMADSKGGPELVFVTLPRVLDFAFADAPVLNYVFCSLFYILLLLAALTSSISMHEINTAYIGESFHLSRRKAAVIVTLVCLFFGAACSLSFGPWEDVKVFGMGFFQLFDDATAKVVMPLGGLLITLFVGWRMDKSRVMDELTNGGTLSAVAARVMMFLIRWVAPIGVSIVFVNELWKTIAAQ